MPYSTLAQLQTKIGIARLTEISDPDETGAPDPEVVAAAIDEADRAIDMYVGKQASVPLASPPDPIVKMSIRWAIRVLRTNAAAGQMMTADVEAEKADREVLPAIAKGLVSLGVDPAPPKPASRVDKAAARDSTLDISRAKMKVFI